MLVEIQRRGPHPRLRPMATGFYPLDTVLDGGLAAQDLVLIAGAPGVGKTVLALQWARSLAQAGVETTFVCFEHDQATLLGRLLALEMAELALPGDLTHLPRYRTLLRQFALGGRSLEELYAAGILVQAAHAVVADYAPRLHLVRPSASSGDLTRLRQLVEGRGEAPAALFVDYLQKVIAPDAVDPRDRIQRVAEGLKEIAISCSVPVVAIAAAEGEGLGGARLRLRHVRGAEALAYEADIAIVLNPKQQVVSKVHLAYGPSRAELFSRQLVVSIEKNRAGQAGVDMEFQTDFANYRIDPAGSHVTEQLIDDRLVLE